MRFTTFLFIVVVSLLFCGIAFVGYQVFLAPSDRAMYASAQRYVVDKMYSDGPIGSRYHPGFTWAVTPPNILATCPDCETLVGKIPETGGYLRIHATRTVHRIEVLHCDGTTYPHHSRAVANSIPKLPAISLLSIDAERLQCPAVYGQRQCAKGTGYC